MKQITSELLNSISEMYYMETGQLLESITIDEYSFNILRQNIPTLMGSPKQLELFTSVGSLTIKCSQVDLIKRIKDEIIALEQKLKKLQEFENT